MSKKKTDEQIKVINTMLKAREKIQEYIDQNGNFTHNIIGVRLIQVAKEIGAKYANELIDEFDLEDMYGFVKSEE